MRRLRVLAGERFEPQDVERVGEERFVDGGEDVEENLAGENNGRGEGRRQRRRNSGVVDLDRAPATVQTQDQRSTKPEKEAQAYHPIFPKHLTSSVTEAPGLITISFGLDQVKTGRFKLSDSISNTSPGETSFSAM